MVAEGTLVLREKRVFVFETVSCLVFQAGFKYLDSNYAPVSGSRVAEATAAFQCAQQRKIWLKF